MCQGDIDLLLPSCCCQGLTCLSGCMTHELTQTKPESLPCAVRHLHYLVTLSGTFHTWPWVSSNGGFTVVTSGCSRAFSVQGRCGVWGYQVCWGGNSVSGISDVLRDHQTS